MIGEIFTFYSYKGGTGRTMALANIACALATEFKQQEDRILMIDWDLEAPGLHRFFFHQPPGQQKWKLGLIDFLQECYVQLRNLRESLERLPTESSSAIEEPHYKAQFDRLDDYQPIAELLFDKVRFADYVVSTDVTNVYLLPAGGLRDDYVLKINTFNWEEFFPLPHGFSERSAIISVNIINTLSSTLEQA